MHKHDVSHTTERINMKLNLLFWETQVVQNVWFTLVPNLNNEDFLASTIFVNYA